MRASRVIRLRPALCALALISLLLGAAAGDALAKKPWENFDYPVLGDVEIPGYQRHVLDNGLVVYLMEDHQWPLVEGRVLVRTGSVYEPASKVGLASITGDVLRTGGTETMGSDELDETLESMGAYIESNIGDTQGTVSFSFLSKDAARGLELVADVLRRPAFEDDKIDVAKTAARSAIARRNDELMGILQREMPKAVWGPEHPYARHTEYATIDAITRQDLVDFYDYFYHPDQMMIAVWGDLDADAMLKRIEAAFGDWPKGENPLPPLPEAPKEKPRQVYTADKEDVNQTWFAVGHVGMKMDDPDYYAMSVMNRILGGGFSDRLFNKVRTDLGLAYGVGSTDGVAMAHPGTFFAYCGTKNGSVEEALGAVIGELERIREEPVSDKELANAKEAMLNSHVFNFVRPSQTLTRLQTYEFLGYPSDFIEQYPEKVREVDKAMVQDVAERRIRPDEFAIVAVGKESEWDGDLTSFGPVEQIDISIPEPEGPEFPEPTAETIEKGRALLAQSRKALGGAALEELSSLKRSDAVAMSMQGMTFNVSLSTQTVFPDRTRADMKLPFGEVIQVVDGDQCWVKSPQGLQDITGEQAEEMRQGVLEDPHYLLGHFDDFQVQALEPEAVGEKEAQVVLVWVSDEDWMKFYIDPVDGSLLRTATMGKHPMTQASGVQESTYEGWKDFGGILFPQKVQVTHGGEELMSVEVQSIEVNPSIDESVFAKPQS